MPKYNFLSSKLHQSIRNIILFWQLGVTLRFCSFAPGNGIKACDKLLRLYFDLSTLTDRSLVSDTIFYFIPLTPTTCICAVRRQNNRQSVLLQPDGSTNPPTISNTRSSPKLQKRLGELTRVQRTFWGTVKPWNSASLCTATLALRPRKPRDRNSLRNFKRYAPVKRHPD
jgi:hypothetical protein